MNHSDRPASAYQRILAIAERRPRCGVALALALRRRADGGTPEEQAWAAYICGMAHIAWERFPEARAFIGEAAALFEQLGDRDGRLRCRRAELTIDHLCGVGLRLQEAWRALAEAHEAAGDPLGAARARMDQAAHLNVLERPDEALALVAAIAPLIDASGTAAERARLLRIAAIANTSAGRFAEARRLVDRAIELYAAQRLWIDVAKCWHERAWIAIRLERNGEAQAELERAAELFRQRDVPLNAALCLKNLGLIASRLGCYAQAMKATAEARKLLIGLQRLDFVTRCELHLGINAYYSGLFDLALACYRRAEAGYLQQGILRHARLTQRNRALVLYEQHQFLAALALLRSIEQAARDDGDTLELAEILFEQARAHRELAHVEEAFALIERAEQLFLELGNLAATAECHLERGWLYLSFGNYGQAELAFQNAAAPLADRPAHRWRVDHGLARCAEQRGALVEALHLYRRASDTVATLRRSLASEHAASGLFVQAQQLYADALRLAVALDDPIAGLELIEQQRALALQGQVGGSRLYFHEPALQERHAQLRARLHPHLQREQPAADLDELLLEYLELLLHARHVESFPREAAPDPLDLNALRTQLDAAFPSGWTALVYALCGARLVTVTLDGGGATFDVTPLDAQLEGLLQRAADPAYRRLTYLDVMGLYDPARQPWAELDALARRLLPEAVRRSLDPERRLLIVPAGPLHLLPWAALRLDGAWLCERATLQILPGLALWPELQRRRPSGDDLLLIGCSRFAGRAPPLPGVADELRLVAERWPGNRAVWLEEGATVPNLLACNEQGGLRRFRAIHIASHARLFAGRGLLAHIKLWDGDLLLDDIARLELGGALVVLAVCDGAASETLPGEELLGLGRAVLAAGAREVIASIWPTYDAPIQEFLDLLYEGLARGEDAATALAMAQRELARRYRPWGPAEDPTSPLVWGGFALLGAGT